MTATVGTEYLIGNAFIYLTDERFLTVKDLNNYRREMQNYWNSNGIDAVITGNIENATYYFDKYFEFQHEASLIILKPNITKEDLKQRFIGYLPLNVLLSFKKVSKTLR